MTNRRALAFTLASVCLFACTATPYAADEIEGTGGRSPDGPAAPVKPAVDEVKDKDDGALLPLPTEVPDKVVERTEGMPELTKVVYFGLKNNDFPTYLSHLLGSKYHLFNDVEIKNPTKSEQTVVLRGSLQGYTKAEAVGTVKLGPEETKKGWFDATLDIDALKSITAPISATYQITLETTDRKILNARQFTVRLLPKGTVLWAGVFNGSANGVAEREAVVGVMTTPRDSKLAIDRLLKEAAPHSKYKAMLGYQYRTPSSTVEEDIAGADDQMGAIYRALQGRGFNYTHLPTAFFDAAQSIRYPLESLDVASANCIDATLVFASALEAMGMAPFVVFVPGHAFVGVHAAPSGPGYDAGVFAETTMLGTHTWEEARSRALAEWNEHSQSKQAMLIDVQMARKNGWLPFPM